MGKGGQPVEYDVELDASGMHCPLPLLKTKKALAGMHSGQILKLTTTDPGAEQDFRAFAKQTGNTLLLQQAQDGKVLHWLRRR